ncbi:MAG: DEAD/DEAH box helicase family protein [Acidobacteria bacterium]|nr:DEAD/DEAH box helicase family protein [Acidobacteriota bacterium]
MTDFSFTSDENLTDLGGTASKYEANIAALTILKELEVEGRDVATAHEQSILARYTGWGDSTLIKRAFPNGTHAAALPAEDLAALTTPEEQRALRASSINAHYTSIAVISAIYQGLLHLGLAHATDGRYLRVLEPAAAGVGHFFGAMPDELKRKAQFAAVELDPLSARITKLLYPSANVYAEGYESANLPAECFDLVISNVPFGNYKVCDLSVREHFLRASIHDYFFAKSLRVVRAGGIIAFITSRFTLDKQDARVRRYIAQHAELLASVRLPNNAFTANAGTQVVTDIIILRKRTAALSPDDAKSECWTEATEYTVTDERGVPVSVTLNRMFAEDERLMLGRPCIGQHGLYGRNEFTVTATEGTDLKDELIKTLRRALPADLLVISTGDEEKATVTADEAKQTSYEPDSLELAAQTELAGFSEARASLEQARAGHLLEIYRAAKEVIRIQVDGEPEESLQTAQAELGRTYDRFRIRYGYINSRQNLTAFNEQNSILAFLRALEEAAPHGAGYRKAPLFTTRTIRPLRITSRPESAAEALLLTLNEQGRADLEAIALSCGKSVEQVREELRGLIYQTPSGEWLTRDEYLSGNVRARLREAEAAARLDANFQENVEALRAAQPTQLGAGEITARLGAAWIPEEVIEQFARSLVPSYRGKIRYLAQTAQWVVEHPSWDAAASVEATQTWGTTRVHALDILDDALNLRRTLVFDQIDDKTRIINQTETVAAQAKLADMKERFLEWVWKDATRERELCRLYNEQFNVMRERRYDGSHLTLPGASNQIELRPAQKDAVWRILQSKTTLVAHTVGAGKTLTAIAAVMELRRLGLARKSMIVVPKHVAPQWAREAQRLYPNLRLMTTDAKDFTKNARGETMSRIATCDWDLIVIPHPSFKLLPTKAEMANHFILLEMERLRNHIAELAEDDERGNRRSIKQIEKTLKRFEAKLKTAEAEIRRDSTDTITFEEMGIEALFVDEFQNYKNLYFPTKMSRIAGLSNTESQQAFDMFIKSQWLLQHGGRFIGLTGTPISNTLCEGYVMMRYFQLDLLREFGLDHFDSWAQSFGETVTGVEMRPDGSGFRVNTRFAKFVNLAELARMQRLCWDVRTPEQLNLPRPALAGGCPITVAVEASPKLEAYVGELSRRSERVSNRSVDPSQDNMLKITSDGRKAALDMRLVRPELGELPYNKIDAVVERVGRIYQRTHANRGAQILFCDLSTPKSSGGSRSDSAQEKHKRASDEDIPLAA